MKIKFSKNFWWGTATSGPQSEGSFNKQNINIMEEWYRTSPNDFHNFIGPYTASNVYYQYKEDVEMMSNLKLNSFRTSIQRTRLIKNLHTNEVDDDAVKFYRDYFSKLKSKNIITIVNLFHFDMPKIFQDIGGFENEYVIEKYKEYAELCFEIFGDIVDYWCTFNEPVVPIEACYLYQWYYPKIVDFKRAIQAAYGTILAHSKAVESFRKIFKNDKNKKICIILNLTPTYPKDGKTFTKEDKESAEIRDMFFNKVFLDPVVGKGFPKKIIELLKEHDLLPKYKINDINIIKNNRIDFLGVNYYQPARVQKRESKYLYKYLMPEYWFEYFDWKNKRVNPYRGWEIYPKTIYDIGMLIKNEYGNIPWFISENGMGVEGEIKYKNDSMINDDYRIDFIKEHLYWLNKAIENGSNCFGYHLWTFIDCWSWANSYKNRYGLVELDLITQKRTIKKSGWWLKSIIENGNEIEIDDNLIK